MGYTLDSAQFPPTIKLASAVLSEIWQPPGLSHLARHLSAMTLEFLTMLSLRVQVLLNLASSLVTSVRIGSNLQMAMDFHHVPFYRVPHILNI